MTRRRRRRGFALPVVLAALVLLTALVAGMLFIATEELRAGRTDVAEEQALAAAELALLQALAHPRLRGDSLAALAPGATIDLSGPSVSPPGIGLDAPPSATTRRVEVVVRATRSSERLAWVVARSLIGGDGSPLAVRRTVAAAMRIMTPRFAPAAALTAGGSVTVTGDATVNGTDPATGGESCASLAAGEVAGVAVPDTMRVCDGICPTPGVPAIVGAPSRLADPAAADSATYERFGAVTRDRLAASADIVLEGGAYAPSPKSLGDMCDRAEWSNWGDPSGSSPCADYYPVIRVRGDVTLESGSAGQGILIADGDVTFEGAARFVGVVVARDDLMLRGTGSAIVGAAFARDVDGRDATHIDLGAAVHYSRCAVHRAAVAASRLERVGGHWWAELR